MIKIIHKINCSCKKSDIRKTKKNVKTRLKQHKKDIEKNSDIIVSKHIQENLSQSFNFDYFQILGLEKNKQKILVSQVKI